VANWPYFISAFVILGISVVLGRAFAFRSRRYRVNQDPGHAINLTGAAERLSGAVRLPTYAVLDSPDADREPFLQFARYLEQAYPVVHAALEREIVSDYSLLYRWKGQDEGLKPVLFSTHFDVVPVEEGTESAWSGSAVF
jgi:carboxypeptidase PM20D1